MLLALLSPDAVLAGERELLAAEERYLARAQAAYPATPDGVQAGYDAGRDLVDAVLAAGLGAAGAARPPGRSARRRAGAASRGPKSSIATPASAALGRSRRFRRRRQASARAGPTRGWDAGLLWPLPVSTPPLGIWIHDLATGRYASHDADTRFAAASTVKLGALVAALRASPQPERSRWWWEIRQLGFWSSNLAANRILTQLGHGKIADGLRRLGMTSSTFPGPYRATTARPPRPHTRVTTAGDLGRALYRLHAAAHGDARALGLLGLTRRQAVARPPRACLVSARRGQRRPAATVARRRDAGGEKRLDQRYAHDGRRSSTGTAAQRSSWSSSTGRA